MATLVTYSNAFNPENVSKKVVESGYINDAIDNIEISKEHYHVVVSRNGVITTDNFFIEEDDIVAISFTPAFTGIATAFTAVMTSLAATGATVVTALGISSMAAWGFGTLALVGAITTVGGSLLMNALFAPKVPDLGSMAGLNASPTYSWDSKRNTATQGGAVPVLYGTHRVTPPLVGKYIESIDTDQYINLLYAVSDGYAEINHDSVFINGETISNYKDAVVYSRRGEIDQTPIGIFSSTRSDKSVNKTMEKGGDYVYSETVGNNVTGLTVSLNVPSGLWRINENGKTRTLTAIVSVEYLSNNDQWIPISGGLVSDYNVLGYWARGDSEKNLVDGEYETTYYFYKYSTYDEALNLGCRGDYGDYVETSTSLPLNSVAVKSDESVFASIVYEEREDYSYITSEVELSGNSQTPKRFTYAVQNLPAFKYQIRAKHHSSVYDSGDPHGDTFILDYLQEEIEDAFTYPNTSLLALRILATDQLSGTIPTVSVIASNSFNNPSTACKDVLEKTGVTLNQNALDSFSDWEQHCNDKNYSCNIYIDSIQTVRKVLDIIAPLGRGNVLQSGSSWRVIVDRADETPVQGFLFTMGNIVKDSFSETFLPIQDRANKIELTYYDKNYDYEPQILEVTNSTYDNAVEINSSSIQYIGCTDRDMAIKYSKYLLNNNRYLTITQSFQIDLEAIVARVGDIVKVAHDVPELSMASGRILSATNTNVSLDVNVDMELGKSYYLEVRRSSINIIEMLEVVNSEIITNELTLVETMEIPLNQYDVYSFGELSRTSKKMRIINISNTSKLRSTISAIEYVPEVYNDTEIIDVSIDGYFGIKHLRANEYITYQGTSAVANVTASWVGESMWYDIYLDEIFNQRVFTSYANIENIPAPATIAIEIRDSFGDKEEISVGLLGRFAPPEPPKDFTVIQNDNLVRFSWIKSISLDVTKYEIRNGLSWETGFKIGLVGNVTTFEWFPDMDGTYKFWIKSIDETDVYSSDALEIQFNITNIISNLNIVIDYDGLDTDTPPCGITNGLVFIQGVGYQPISVTTFGDIPLLTFADLNTNVFNNSDVSFESCDQDTGHIGITKIRLLANYSAISVNSRFGDFPDRKFGDFPFDTLDSVTAETTFKMYYALSDDAITYTDFIEYTGILDETFRYIKFKYAFLDDLTGLEVSIDDFKAILDVPDIEYEILDKEIVESEIISYNTYGLAFYQPPYIGVTSKDSISLPVVKNITNTSFTLEAYDSDGVATTSNFNISIKGY
jgi:hypothetical protein